MGRLTQIKGEEAGKKEAKALAKKLIEMNRVIDSSDNIVAQNKSFFKLHKTLFKDTGVNAQGLAWAIEHGDNGLLLQGILKKEDSIENKKIAILKLLTADEGRIFSRGGFGEYSLKVAFVGKFLNVNFSKCHSDSERKQQIKTELSKMQSAAKEGSPLKTALNEILESKTFRTTPAAKPALVVATANTYGTFDKHRVLLAGPK